MSDTDRENHLDDLGPRFLEGLRLRAEGKTDEAMEVFAAVLRAEPRLAEPRLEMGRVWLEQGRLDDAEPQLREAIRILELGGQWTEEVPEHVLLAMAWALLGEVLKQQAASDDVVFGAPERFEELLRMSRVAFARAAELDPEDSVSALNAAELGDRDDDAAEPPEDDA